MSKENVAVQYFHVGPLDLPCSSAISAAFKGPHDPSVEGTKKFRGGNAPNNECGAITAAKLIRPDLEDILLNKFLEVAGSWKCKDLRGDDKFGCQNCLITASDVLEQNGEKTMPVSYD